MRAALLALALATAAHAQPCCEGNPQTWFVVVLVMTLDMKPRLIVHWEQEGDGGSFEDCQEWAEIMRQKRKVVAAWCENTEQLMRHKPAVNQ